jgi:hypothetical protein
MRIDEVRNAVLRAKYHGELVPASKCEECGFVGKLHGHHEGYSKPLDVMRH